MTRTLLAAVAAVLIPLSLAGPAWGCDAGRRAAAAHSAPAAAGRAPLEVGDSTSIFAAPVLGRMGIEADAHGCRNFGQGLGILSSRRHARTLPGVVVMALVANAGVSRSQISHALRILGPSRILALVTAPKSGGGDATLRAAAAAHPDRVLLIDWAAYSAGHGSWFGGDGLHVGQPGADAFARLIRRRIDPYAFPPVRRLKLPRHTTSATACATVTRARRRSAVFVVRGHRILSCARARELARSPLLHPPAGWRTYDWRRTGHGRWLRVMRRLDGKALLATAAVKARGR
jgi:hypothetical protein